MAILQPDSLTGGIITGILEQSWIAHKAGTGKLITAQELKLINDSLIKHDYTHKEIFRRVPRSVWTSIDARNHKGDIDFFEYPGFIFQDGMHASSFGEFNYIYRAKGLRTIWFESGHIMECTIHSSIDDNGFLMVHEDIDGIDFSDPEISSDFFNDQEYRRCSSPCDQYRDPQFIIDNLLRITKSYNTAYYMEYLLDPPDVKILSDFSARLKREIWSSVLQLGDDLVRNSCNYQNIELFKFCVDFMKSINQDVDSQLIIEFFEKVLFINNLHNREQIKEILNELKFIRNNQDNQDRWMRTYGEKIDTIADKEDDIIELKPNIAGIGINLNQAYKKIKGFGNKLKL